MQLCEGGFRDTDTGLCWQDPPSEYDLNWFEASGTEDPYSNPEATDYCGSGEWGDHTDWRLPDIDELISLMRGCIAGDATGDLSSSICGVEDPGCLEQVCDSDDCEWCTGWSGPGQGGCYWDPTLIGGRVYPSVAKNIEMKRAKVRQQWTSGAF
ncbi:MAG: DUF1566 domain-containing protein [Polyangia bacterium]